MARPTGRPIREEIIDAACTLVQRVGINGFSYGDLAAQLGIAAPSIHHHFRKKDELIGEVAARYCAGFEARRDEIDATSAAQRLGEYAALFRATASTGSMCLCGSVASDWLSAGERSRVEVAAFFDDQVEWLRDQIIAGVETNEFSFDGTPSDFATALLASLEGALLMSRASGDPTLSTAVSETMVGLLSA